jgi:exonuclease SbcC
MKILAIRIKNLASLVGDTVIDFAAEPLCSAGIFAITGPTGAGKSTILDALCLALYAKTPRYLQAKESGIDVQDIVGSTISQSDIRGILRDGTGEGFAEVDFVAVDGQHYRATWTIRRARNKAEGSLQKDSLSLKNISTNADLPGRKTDLLPEIERLVGLNFEQFTRSVLLAQGDFTAFLKAPKDEKSSLLEKLTGTQIYSEISQRIFEKHRLEAQQLRDLNLKREGIFTLTGEELDAYTQQKSAIELSIQEQEKQLDLLTREITWHTQFSLLQLKMEEAGNKHRLAIEAKTNAVNREQKLKQVERVQTARSIAASKEQTEKQLSDKSSALIEMEEKLLALQKQKEELEVLLLTASNDLIAKTNAREEAKPLLEEAKVLDVQISERTAQVTVSLDERNRALQNKKQQEAQWKEKQQEAAQLIAGIAALKKWKEENTARQPVAENQNLIVSKLGDAQKQLDALQDLTTNFETTTKNIDKQKSIKEKLAAAAITISGDLETSQPVYDQLLAALSVVELPLLENEKAAIDQQLEDLIGAEAHWKIVFSKLTDFTTLSQKLVANKEDFSKKEALLKGAAQQLNDTQVQRDASLRMLDKARLASAENVESLRQQLVPGDVCPVCGSEEHPYAHHNPQLDYVMAELQLAHNINELAFRESLKKQSGLEQNCTLLKKAIADQEAAIATDEPALKLLQADWENYAVYKDCKDISDADKASWLQEQVIATRALQKNRNEKLQTYHANKQLLDKQQQLIIQLEAQRNENSNKIKDIQRELQSYNEQIEQNNKTLAKLTGDLLATEKMLSPYFTAVDWFSQWKKDPAQFIQQVNAFAIKWKADIQKLDEETGRHSVLSETLKAMQDRAEVLQAELGKKETNLAGLTDQLNAFNKQRILIFNGQAVLKIEGELQQGVDKAQQALDKNTVNKETLQTSITRLATQKEQTENDIAKLQLQLKLNIEKIQDWLMAHNAKNASKLDEGELLKLLELSQEWIETEQAFLRSIEDAITQAVSVLNERKASLEIHEKQRLSEKQLDELNELFSAARELLRTSIENKNQIQFQLDQDEANKQKIGNLLNTINAKALIVENWAKLNDIIGSSDGKKFRQVAQEYTLDILLGYANVHLELLSKRYLLQRIPDTLGLQVIDQDMGNEIRTVFSLSGGESFLVSLALALGLASLSSSRMQVESLFIDEGFGSLDPTTLNIAMDALERLHNQGRKVGVISHVQEMTERIPVQIKVSKQNSGKSVVEVKNII